MLHGFLFDASFWQFLFRLDEGLAAEVQAVGCPYCGALLHSARYPRKPRGAPRSMLGSEYEWRLSFCCAQDGCRRRTTPPSVRFFGRRVYLGALVVMLSAFSRGITGKRRTRLRELVPVSDRTLKRWRRWWRECFPTTPLWYALRGRFIPPLDTQLLPASVLERFGSHACSTTLCKVLHLLAPLTTTSCSEKHPAQWVL